MPSSITESGLPQSPPNAANEPGSKLSLLFYLGVLLVVEVVLVVCLRILGWDSTGYLLPYLLALLVCSIAGIHLVRNRFRFSTRAVLIGFALLSAAFAFVNAQWIQPYTSRMNCKVLREHEVATWRRDDDASRGTEIDAEVAWINPAYDHSLSESALRAIERLPNLDEIVLSGYVTDRGLSIISGYHGSRRLGLGLCDPGITDRGLKLLKDCQWMERLYISGATVTDAGLVTVSQFGQLEELGLRRDGHPPLDTTQVTDEGLVSIGRMENLKGLSIWRLDITDEGLAHLAGMHGLRSLVLEKTQCTSAGIADLQRKLPQCKIVVK